VKNSNKKELEHLYKWRELQDKERIKIANSFDKYLLTFATGTLYLSISFTSSIKDLLGNKKMLGVGWVFLIISITFTLFTIFLSNQAFSRGIDITDNAIRDVLNSRKQRKEDNYWNTVTIILQIVGIITFIAGIILLSIVYYTNLK